MHALKIRNYLYFIKLQLPSVKFKVVVYSNHKGYACIDDRIPWQFSQQFFSIFKYCWWLLRQVAFSRSKAVWEGITWTFLGQFQNCIFWITGFRAFSRESWKTQHLLSFECFMFYVWLYMVVKLIFEIALWYLVVDWSLFCNNSADKLFFKISYKISLIDIYWQTLLYIHICLYINLSYV